MNKKNLVVIMLTITILGISCKKTTKDACTCRWQVITKEGAKIDSKTFPDKNFCKDAIEHEGENVTGADATIAESKGGKYTLTCQ
ncbi:MAG: hypothetical protein ACRCSB_02695 [Bacteroidales bacterium]